MKKILSFIVAFLLVGGLAFAQGTPGFRSDPGVGDILGQKKYQSDAHKIFRMVRFVPVTYAGASTLAADSLVIWELAADDGVTITTSTLSGDSAVAGIIVQQALTPDTDGNTAAQDVGRGNWTWLQTYGLSQVDLATGTSNALVGAAFGISTVAGEAATYNSNVSPIPTTQGIAGFFYDAATAADNNVQCFLKGLD